LVLCKRLKYDFYDPFIEIGSRNNDWFAHLCSSLAALAHRLDEHVVVLPVPIENDCRLPAWILHDYCPRRPCTGTIRMETQ